ncbi:MAG TPA: glycosyltransferase family 1 protein [Lutibacter sp.]|nr:glycosyltransferase family 1 protein [Lutibacter sp.]
MKKPKLLRITTVPISLHKLLQGQVNYMQKQDYEVVLASAVGKEIKAIENETGLKVQILPLTRKISPLQDIKALWKTYKLIKKEQPNIVHTHTPKAGVIGMLAAKLARVPVRMHTIAGLPLMQATGVKRKLLDSVERMTSWAATNVYPNSFALAEFIKENKLAPKRKIKVLAQGSSNGIDTAYFDPKCYKEAAKNRLKEKLNITSNDFVFTFIGRLVGDKGINELVTAFKRLQGQTPFPSGRVGDGLILLLIGDEEAQLDPLATTSLQEIAENSNIISTGWVEDVRPYLSISDVFVFPSYREGMPNVVLQAGAMGLPQVVTNINGSNEIIINDENGIIIPVKDTTALFKAIKEIHTNTKLRNKLATNARELITTRFEQKVVWEALLAEYKRLL